MITIFHNLNNTQSTLMTSYLIVKNQANGLVQIFLISKFLVIAAIIKLEKNIKSITY